MIKIATSRKKKGKHKKSKMNIMLTITMKMTPLTWMLRHTCSLYTISVDGLAKSSAGRPGATRTCWLRFGLAEVRGATRAPQQRDRHGSVCPKNRTTLQERLGCTLPGTVGCANLHSLERYVSCSTSVCGRRLRLFSVGALVGGCTSS